MDLNTVTNDYQAASKDLIKRLKTDIKDGGKLLGSIEIPVTSDMREAILNRSEFELRGTEELFDPDDPETMIGKVKWKFIVSDFRPLPKKVISMFILFSEPSSRRRKSKK